MKDLAIADKKKIVESVQVKKMITTKEPAGHFCVDVNLSVDFFTPMLLQEYYGDYNAINRHLFTINVPDRSLVRAIRFVDIDVYQYALSNFQYSMLACVDHYRERGSCLRRCTEV